MIVGTATPSASGTLGKISLRRKLHSHDLPCTEELGHVAICSPHIHQQLKILPYAFYSIGPKGILETLGDLLVSSFYARARPAMQAVRRLPSFRPASSLGPHTSEVAAAESDVKDVVEIPIDDGATGKAVAVCDSDT